MTNSRLLFLFLTFLLTFLSCSRAQGDLLFEDVTRAVGITQEAERDKWGGPCVADLDGDGIYDLVLSFHFSAPVQIYWGQPDGTFLPDSFTYQSDVHGINVAPRTAFSQERLLVINRGGGRGNSLNPPLIYLVTPDRALRNVSNELGLGVHSGRGRVTLFMDLAQQKDVSKRAQRLGGPDMLVVGYVAGQEEIPQHAYENERGWFRARRPLGFEDVREGRAAVADVDGDGVVEVLSFPQLRMYKLEAGFRFREMTGEVLGEGWEKWYENRTVAAVAEFDMNNRGEFDLYLARAESGDLIPSKEEDAPIGDVLLRQNKGGMTDVSLSAGIPQNTRSMGVTTGDFDNDGFMDIFLAVADGPDVFLMNMGNETFRRVYNVIPKRPGTPGGNAVAVDYDADGRLDLLVGQGQKEGPGGPYRIMRNVMKRKGHYLLVRVGNHPWGVATALHAVVEVVIGGMKLRRRVGSPGTQAGGPSFLDTVHFGLGDHSVVREVSVRWTSGRVYRKKRVDADQKITFGYV